jgi:hypothetical protein
MGVILDDETIGRGILGYRMEFLSEDAELRDSILERLDTEDPLEIALSIAVGDINFNLIDDQKLPFAEKLGQRLGEDAKRRYLQGAPEELLPRNGDSGGNRRAFYEWWVAKRDGQLVEEMSRSLSAVLAVGTRIGVAWSPDLTGDREASVSADPNAQPPLLIFHTQRGRPPVETDATLPMREPLDPEEEAAD